MMQSKAVKQEMDEDNRTDFVNDKDNSGAMLAEIKAALAKAI